MRIDRWTADVIPSEQIILRLLESEGLEVQAVTVGSGSKLSNKRTLMTEVIQVAEGELIFNLPGTQFVLRPGDRLEMASNTQYSYSNIKENRAVFFTALKV